jgi:hypothetical protein
MGKAEGILRSIDTGLPNGVLEAINGDVQAAKRKAKGYRTKRNLETILYLPGVFWKYFHDSASPAWLMRFDNASGMRRFSHAQDQHRIGLSVRSVLRILASGESWRLCFRFRHDRARARSR